MTKQLRIGYVPLTGAALLHVVKAQDFAASRGLDIELTAVAGAKVSAQAIEQILAHPASPSHIGLRIAEGAIKADPAHALWLYAQMVATGQCAYSDALAQAPAAIYAPGLGPALSHAAGAPVIFGGPQFSREGFASFVAALRELCSHA
jgi:hypothetical protein